jgi:hypothetical protein
MNYETLSGLATMPLPALKKLAIDNDGNALGKIAENFTVTRMAEADGHGETIAVMGEDADGDGDPDFPDDMIDACMSEMSNDQLILLNNICVMKTQAALDGTPTSSENLDLDDADSKIVSGMTDMQRQLVKRAADGHGYIPTAVRAHCINRGIGQ